LIATDEIDHVNAGLQGNLLKIVSLDDGTHDSYRDHEFYGWCKRYPPRHQDSYAIISFRSLFSILSRKIPKKIADYQFPILSHENTCGEWKQGDWVQKFIIDNKVKPKKI
jgi:hypothetical protein